MRASEILIAIRRSISRGEYDLTVHAVEEMTGDDLDVYDIENAVLTGVLVNEQTDDPRGTRYTIAGFASDRKTRVEVVGRFKETGVFLVITVYAITVM